MSDPYVPTATHPNPPAKAPKRHQLVIGAGGEEYLGPQYLQFRSGQFVGEKAAGVNNSGQVVIKVQDSSGNWVSARPVNAGTRWDWATPQNDRQGFYSGLSFRISGAVGDGIALIYTD